MTIQSSGEGVVKNEFKIAGEEGFGIQNWRGRG